jgi:hypothetical protein
MFEEEFGEYNSDANLHGTARDGGGSGLCFFVVCGFGGFDEHGAGAGKERV